MYRHGGIQVGGRRAWQDSPLMVRGTAAGLEFVFARDGFDDAWTAIAARLTERPDFYRGSQATAIFDGEPPGDEALARVVAQALAHGVTLRGIYGGSAFAAVAERLDLAYLGEPPRPTVANFERKRAAKANAGELTEHARSLDADFAGARADIAKRRARGEPSVPKPRFAPGTVPPVESPAVGPAPGPTTLYHRGTLRGGQALQHLGSIVVIGDVNPGAELVATGDIVVFGALRGTAHAGAQGDAEARVYALDLAPTQLRIAACIAAGEEPRRGREPEVAYIVSERIAIAPYAKIGAP
ncbi:MAG: hypothetical protein NVSMB19_17100 [Vulcanimicrobiaceae bacterium]